ncbi:MAG: fibronectin type III domain-containing protein, partial [Actinomycetota bacterium]
MGSIGDNSKGQLGNGTFTNKGTLTLAGCPLTGSPTQPINVIATAADGSATVRWQAPASQGSNPITSYKIDSSGRHRVVVTAPVGGPAPTEATVPGLINGQSYVFSVQAINSRGVGAKSTSSNVVVPRSDVPSVPRNVLASINDSSATVSWTPPLTEGASPITSYTAIASPGGLTLPVSGSPPATATTFTGLTYGITYTFKIVATNSHGPSTASAPSNSVVPSRIPDTPTQVVAEAGDRLAIVRWTPGYHGGRPVTNVRVTASPGGGSVDVKCGVSSVTFTGLTNGTTYSFSVVATNPIGSSASGDTATSITPAPRSAPMGYYTDGAKTRFGNLASPSPNDSVVPLRGVGTEWLDFDL